MSKSRMLLSIGGVVCLLLTVSLIFFVNGAVTLVGENKQIKAENTKIQYNNGQLNKEIQNLNKSLKQDGQQIQELNQKLQEQTDQNKQLQDDYNQMKQERDKALSQASAKPQGRDIMVIATAYTPYCNTGCTGITATGINVGSNPNAKVVSVDPNIIPLGSKLYVEGYGYAVAGDTGGAIKGNHVDLLVPNTETAVSWGRRTVKITILN